MNPDLFVLEAFFEDYEHAEGMNVLGTSDAHPMTLAELTQITGLTIPPDMSLGYTEPAGTPQLVAALAAHYDVSADRVLVTAGANEAVFLAVASLLERGHRALLCKPAYQSLEEAAKLAGATIDHYHYAAAKGFALDVDSLLRGIPAAAVAVLNTPHNPTSRVLSDALLEDIASRAAANGTRLVVDEVMHGIFHEGVTPTRSAARFADAVVIGSTSKVFGLGGLRIGWIIAPPADILRFKRFRYYTTICPAAPSQLLATEAIRHAAVIVGRNQELARSNLRIVQRWLEENRDLFDSLDPEGGTTMIIRLRDGRDADAFTRALARERRVLLVPCDSAFGMPRGTIRLGLGTDSEKLRAGLTETADFLRRTADR